MPTPDDEIADNIVRRFQSRENSSIVNGLEQDKNKAADSLGLSKTTGESPERILSEYDRIYKKSKGEAAQQIVEQEPWLRQYVRENPVNAAVSQDDWGALSEYTQAIKNFNKFSEENIPWIFRHGVQGTGFMVAKALPHMIDDVKAGIKGITDQFSMPQPEPEAEGEEKLPSYLDPTVQRQLDDYVAKNKQHLSATALVFGAMQILGAPLSGLIRSEGFIPATEGIIDPAVRKLGEQFGYEDWGARADIVEGLVYSALLVGGAIKKVTPKGIAETKVKWAEAAQERAKEVENKQLSKVLDRAIRTFENAETWIKSGQRPPKGVDPVLDQLIGLESINRMTALDAVLEKGNKTEGKELSPEAFANLNKIAFKEGDRSIYLRWDAAKSLYGDKLPEPGDKLLGDVPRIAEQFERSGTTTGEPIEIPMELLPGLDKELYKLIHEDLFFEGGMSVKEAKELVKAEPEISTIHEQEMPGLSEDLRRPYTLRDPSEAAPPPSDKVRMYHGGELPLGEEKGGLWFTSHRPKAEGWAAPGGKVSYVDLPADHPLIDTGVPGQGAKEGFTVEREFPEEIAKTRKHLKAESAERTADGVYDVINEKGEKTGQVVVVEQEGGKNLFLGWEKGQYDTAGLITLMNQLKAKYPNAETITTVRIPGVRSLESALQGSDIEVDMPFRIKNRLVDLIRKSAGLEPLFDLSDEGPRAARIVKGYPTGLVPKEHAKDKYTITDEVGRPLAALELEARDNGKEVYVGWLGKLGFKEGVAEKREEALSLLKIVGPNNIKSFVEQLKGLYPEVEKLTYIKEGGSGLRAAVAREKELSLRPGGLRPGDMWSGKKMEINLKDLMDEVENAPAGWHPTKPLGPEHAKLFDLISEGFTDIGGGRWAQVGGVWGPHELRLEATIDKFLAKVTGGNVDIVRARAIRSVGPSGRVQGHVAGFFRFYTDRRGFIMWALEAPDAYATAGHEAIHFLRHHQYIMPWEWDILKKAAEDGGWLDRPEMDRYAHFRNDKYMELFYEEAIADEFKRWAKMDRDQQNLHGMAKVFQKIRDMVDGVKSAYREWSGKDPTADQIMRDIQLGRIAKRTPMGASQERLSMFGMDLLDEGAKEKPKPPEVRPLEENVPTFAPGAIMDKKMYAQYQRHMNEQNANDIRIEREKAVIEARRRNAPEWRANREVMKGEVAQEIGARPDFRARAFFQNGTFFGQETHYMPKIDPKLLTKEQRAAFPARWQEKGGMDPDMLSQPFGYQTGAQMVDALIQFEKARGKLTPKDFLEKVVNDETDRRMELKYGDLAEKNLQEAMEQVIGHDQLELLKEEAIALAARAGMKISLSKGDIQAMAHESFLESQQTKASYKYFMQELYRTGKEAERRFLAEDYIGAFNEKWMQVHIHEQARLVKKLDKQKEAVGRITKRFYKRYPDNFPAEFTEFIQQLIVNAGYSVDRHPDDLVIAFQSREHKGDLVKFVDDINAVRAGEEKFEASLDPYLIIPDFILDNWPNWKKHVDDMTVGEFRAFHDAIQSLQKIGADQGKLHRLGEAADLQKMLAIGKMQLQNIGPEIKPQAPGKRAKLHQLYHIGTIAPEDLLIRMDKGNEEGFFTKFITDPLNDRAYFFNEHHKAFRQARIDNDKKYGRTTDKKVNNTVFHDPRYMVPDKATGKLVPDPHGFSLLPLTHEHVRGAILNWGNKSNRERLIEGFHSDEATVYKWLMSVSSKNDWKWAEAVGKMYAKLGDMGDEVTMRESNTMVERLPLPQIDTPFGKMDGWYYPVHYDKSMDGGPKNTQLLSPSKNTRTYRGYERKRTGPAGPLELHLNSLDMDMNRRIHDLAYREVLRDFRKILDDPGMRSHLTRYMGRHYYDMLKQLHNDIAQPYQVDSGALAAANRYSEFFRQNTIMYLVGFKVGTFMKHVPSTFVQSWARLGLTKMDFWKSAVELGMTNDQNAVRNWTFVTQGGKVGSLDFAGSREIANRWRHYAQAHGVDTLAMKARSAREFVMQTTSVPIAFGDMISSVILWNSLYKKLRGEYMAQGMTIEEAHTKADTRADFAVRQTHGSTTIMRRPEFMRRTSSLARWMTSLYNYYNHVYGQMYRQMWRTNDMIRERVGGDTPTQTMPKYIGEMAGLTMAYMAMPAAFYWFAQDFLLGKEDDEDDNLAWKIAKPVIHNVGGAFLGVRDILGFVSGGGQQPAPGITAVPLQKAWEAGKLIEKYFDQDKVWKDEDAGKTIKSINSVIGIGTGLSSDQVGIWAQFLNNYLQAIEEPEGAADVYRGLRRGTIERRKR